jgi:nucleoside 2-deoxyribosyltransferase
MKFYIAGRTSKTEDIKEMISLLTKFGHEVTHDWTLTDAQFQRPYPIDIAEQVADKDMRGIVDADIFIILGDKSGTGMYVELGIALATNTKVYSIGENNDVTVFHFLPNVKRMYTFSEVLDDLANVKQ